jgi:Asp-tRNA(Asn)/Glu-tRNA(Gln) amidotransferase B subunit
MDALLTESGDVLARFTKTPRDDDDLSALIASATRLTPDISGEALQRWAMGQVMPRLLGRIDPRLVQQLLTRSLEKP